MTEVRQFARQTIRYVAAAIGTFVLWMFWLALCLIAVGQLYIATRNQLAVPDFVLRRLERRLAESGMSASFARAAFDPTGRILVESPRIYLPEFADPIVSARAAYVGLNPWLLLVGRFEPRELRLVDGTVSVPAMLSPSGRPEPIVRDVDALILPGLREVRIQHANGRIGALLVSAHGTVAYRRTPGSSPGQLAKTIRGRFADFCRMAVAGAQSIDGFDEPSLDLELESSATYGADVTATILARGFKLDAPVVLSLSEIRAVARGPLYADITSVVRVEVSAAQGRFPTGIEGRGLNLALNGRFQRTPLKFEPISLEVRADHAQSPDGAVDGLAGTARPITAQTWRAELVARLLGSSLAVSGEGDMETRSARIAFAGRIAPTILETVRNRSHVDVQKFFDFDAAECERAEVTLGPGGKFKHLTARVKLRGINAHGVAMDEGEAEVDLDPERLYSPAAYARIGANYARGTYEHIFATHQFRFLLEGRLRPMDIAGWFHPWWTNFFEHFEFPEAPPPASVDVQGFWREGKRTSVFVFADAPAPVIYQQPLARIRTRLFIRPGFYDGLELLAVDRAGGSANATFGVATNVTTGKWRTIDVEGRSTVALAVAAGIGGDVMKGILAPFALAHPPTVNLRGHFDGPDLEPQRGNDLVVTARAAGPFNFYHLPFEDVAFTATLHNDDLNVDVPEAKFAGGRLKGHARLSGRGAERRVAFDGTVEDASLGVGIAAMQKFTAARKGLPPPTPGKFVQEKANVRVDLTAAGEGAFSNLLSFHGGGNVGLRGAEIGEVPLFGPLSELLKFTALRFTTAHSTFKINGAKIEFPDVALRGANSAVDAHGEYALDRKQLDFRAKVFPFQESGSVIKSVVGAVLSPISNVLEVKLTGTLEKPDWAFVIGPTNLFRSLAPDQPAEPKTPPPALDAPVETAPPTDTPPTVSASATDNPSAGPKTAPAEAPTPH